MVISIRNEQLYQNTCLQIPYELKKQAREQGINMTQLLVKSLEARLKEVECSGIEQAPTSQPAAPSLDPKRRSRQ